MSCKGKGSASVHISIFLKMHCVTWARTPSTCSSSFRLSAFSAFPNQFVTLRPNKEFVSPERIEVSPSNESKLERCW